MSTGLSRKWYGDTIGSVIRELRADEPQQKFADRVGISRAALSSYENKTRIPDKYTVRKIAKASGISEEDLLYKVTMEDLFDPKNGYVRHLKYKDLFTFESVLISAMSLLSLEAKRKILDSIDCVADTDKIPASDKEIISKECKSIIKDIEELRKRRKALDQ